MSFPSWSKCSVADRVFHELGIVPGLLGHTFLVLPFDDRKDLSQCRLFDPTEQLFDPVSPWERCRLGDRQDNTKLGRLPI